MTKRGKKISAFLSLILCLLIMIAGIPPAFGVSAQSTSEYELVADPSTADDWKQFFGSEVMNTDNAGGIWSDKSVFADASEVGPIEPVSQDSFLVALSTIACDKTITGYAHTPTDTILVLDVSRSMNFVNDAVDELILSANNTIEKLQNVNLNNRVGVVLYSGTYEANVSADPTDAVVLLPLGRYSQSEGVFLVKSEKTVSVGTSAEKTVSIAVGEDVVTSRGESVKAESKAVYGNTYIQGGIFAAMNEFLSIEDTEVSQGEFQSGTQRTPVMVLLGDGVASSATNLYSGTVTDEGLTIGESNMGDGNTPEAELEIAIPFVTQLTASYAKERITEHYGKDTLFYTLGYKIEDSAVLDPDGTTLTDAPWTTYYQTEDKGTMQLAVDSVWISTGFYGSGHWDTVYKGVEKSDYNLTESYVDRYFHTDGSLTEAFDLISDEIINQSVYYPTLLEDGNTHHDGYVEFIDDIGLFMEVKKVHGIQLGEVLFTGNNIASNFIGEGGDLGTIQNPSELGEELISSVKARLGIGTSDAQKLVDDAYNSGQLTYNPETGEYSNYIGWYADAEGNFLSHGTGEDATCPEGAVYYNESYGYLGQITYGYKSTDMMYVSVQVRKEIETGLSKVVFRVPASLIPVITYNVTLTGDSLENPGDVTLTLDDVVEVDTDGDGIFETKREVAPIRLIYEVGLDEDINELTVADLVGEDYIYENDGVYTFFASQWNEDALDHEHPSVAENSVAFYEPSTENERYYYTENSTIYVKEGDTYIPYQGDVSPAEAFGEYYRQYAVFEKINENETANARVQLHYELISSEALSVAKSTKDSVGNTEWYVPKGTIHRMFDKFNTGKGGFTDDTQVEVNSNLTNSLIYSHYLSVEYIPGTDNSENAFYTDVILGNNGSLKLKAAQGIKIIATGDGTLADTEEYSFSVVQNSGETSDSCRVIKVSATGEKEQLEKDFSSGEITVTLQSGESVYIVDLPTDAEYLITESTQGSSYKIDKVNGEEADSYTALIKENQIDKAEFVNTYRNAEGNGSVVIETKVSHPLGEGYAIPEDIRFDFLVEYAEQSREVTVDADGLVVMMGIPVGTQVQVIPVGIPAGFECSIEESTFTVEKEKNYFVTCEFAYTPALVQSDIILNLSKTFSGRENNLWMDEDEFTFTFEKLQGTHWVEMTSPITLTKDNKYTDLSELMQSEVYTAVGVYSYRIAEVYEDAYSKGITYDSIARWFDVYVTDLDMDGSLEISGVTGHGGAVVDLYNEKWVISTDFTNKYSAKGSDSVSVIINKELTDRTLSKAGYEFGLYQNGRLVTVLPETSSEGETLISLTYGAVNIGRHIHYVLKEMVPEESASDREYTGQEFNIIVTVEDDTEGAVKATVYVTENRQGAETLSGEKVEITFKEAYQGEDVIPTEPVTTVPEGSEPKDTEATEGYSAVTDPTSATDEGSYAPDVDVPDTGDRYLLVSLIILTAIAVVFLSLSNRKKVC